MKLLREYIRALLTESIDSKIMSMIDKAEKAGFRAMLRPGYVAVYDPAIDVSDFDDGYVGHKNGIARVTYNRTPGEFEQPCGGARIVRVSSSKDFGMGPLAYDLAIEASGGLVSDRSSVSKEAQAVWNYYMNNRSDVEAVQLDNEDNALTPQDEDNCYQDIARGTVVGMYDTWQDSALSKMYKKSGTPVIDELRRRNMLDDER